MTLVEERRPGADLADEVTAWLEENWDPDLEVSEWWARVAAAGWTAPHFPVDRFGRGLHARSGRTVRSVFKAFGALRPPGGLGLMMAAPTILAMGTPDQQDRFIPSILDGSVGWCQLFSEPGAGSDLAGLTTRAVRDGDQWVITGQKVWSSYAHQAEYGMLLARTDLNVPKHAGISWFAFKLDQPGVEVRPLREMTGDAVFNEVFIDEARVDHADLIGGEGNGWLVTQTTLHFERTGIGVGGGAAGFPEPGPKGGMLGGRAGECALIEAPNDKLTMGFDDALEVARLAGRTERRLDASVQVAQHTHRAHVRIVLVSDCASGNEDVVDQRHAPVPLRERAHGALPVLTRRTGEHEEHRALLRQSRQGNGATVLVEEHRGIGDRTAFVRQRCVAHLSPR